MLPPFYLHTPDLALVAWQHLSAASETDAPTRVYRLHGPRGRWIFGAPHAASHQRDGRRKAPEIGTETLAAILARALGGVALCTAGDLPYDPNWDTDESLPYRSALAGILRPGSFLVDIHGMRDDHGFDLCIGLGVSPCAESLDRANRLRDAAEREGLIVGWNAPFAARSPVTLTAWVQCLRHPALQVEVSRSLRDPNTHPAKAGRLLAAIVEALS